MDFGDELLGPSGARYRTGRIGKRGAHSTRARSSGSHSGDARGNFMENGAQLCSMSESLAAWGYVYQINTQTVAVGDSVNFSNNGPLNGISHTPGATHIEVSRAGTYNLTFSVYTSQNNPQDWSVVVNSVVRQRFNLAGQTISATTTLTLNANDRVTIRNSGTIPDPATLRSGDFTTAYVLIYKVDS